jgi:hypothetical protein
VLKDPNTAGTESDIQAQLRVQTALWEETNKLAATANQIESLRVQLASFEKLLGTDDSSKTARKAAGELGEKLVAFESKLLQLKLTGRGQDDCRWPPMLLHRINYLFSQLDSTADFPPTTQQTAVEEMLKQQGDAVQQEYQQVVAKDLAAFNAMLRERNIANIIVKAP